MTKLFISILTIILLTPLAYADNGQLPICDGKIVHITQHGSIISPKGYNASDYKIWGCHR